MNIKQFLSEIQPDRCLLTFRMNILPSSSGQYTEATRSSEMSVNISQATQRHIPGDNAFYSPCSIVLQYLSYAGAVGQSLSQSCVQFLFVHCYYTITPLHCCVLIFSSLCLTVHLTHSMEQRCTNKLKQIQQDPVRTVIFLFRSLHLQDN